MSQATPTAEERLKELKEAYSKLYSERQKVPYPSSDDYLLQYRRFNPVHSSSQSDKEGRKDVTDEVGYRRYLDEASTHSSNIPPKLKLRPLLEDINRKGPIEKKKFMLQRMDELAGPRPTKVLDFVKTQYPSSDDSSANTFFILGDVHKCIRDYLVANGWVEKYSGPEEKLALTRCLQGYPMTDSKTASRMLSTDPVKFIWVGGFVNWSLINNNIIISRIPSSSFYFSKTALASSIRDLFPFLYQKGLIDVKTPRTYELRCAEDMKHFMKQYRINACISLLRKFVSCMNPPSKIQLFSEDGTVPLECVDFAIQRVVEMIRYSQHADIDEWHFSVVSEEDWSVFIFRFYDIVHQDAKFQINNHNMNVPKLVFASEKVCTVFEKYFPDTKHDGHRNLWIVKPSNGSCGRGVRIFKRLNEIQQYCKASSSYVIQKYIENPMLIYQTKFDVRQWFLITSVYPLVIWMYDECYLRFCSQQFSLSNVHESVHLCNNSIQYKYKNGVRNPQLPDDNMWADSTFQTYLSNVESTSPWPGIKNKMQQAIIAACLVSQDKMYHRTNSFHLYGADFMITPDYDVWLIEINTHPSMKYSTSVTARMCKEVLQDTLKVGLDRRANPQADTGKFIQIYKQQAHMPTVGVPASASGVHARKLRLLNTINPKDQPTKAFLDTTKAPAKFGKWLSYPSIATYKTHNKINFKYVVLRHTDMPLDPGDSITQRDIGYAGVLDKATLDEKTEEANGETSSLSEEIGDKEKNKTPVVSPKPPNQITLHRKVIAKLKAKEKALMEKDNTVINDENSSNKTAGNSKLRNTNEIKNMITQASTSAKQNEVLKSNADMEVQRSKTVPGEVVEVRSITEIIKSKPVTTNKELSQKNQVKTANSKKNTFVEDVKNVSNSENPPPDVKTLNPRKQINAENVVNRKKHKSKNISGQTTKPKNLVTEKTKSVKISINKDKIPSVLKQSPSVVKTEDEPASKVIKDPKIFVLADAIKTRTGLGNGSKTNLQVECDKVSNNSTKSIKATKINKAKRRLSSVKRTKKPSTTIDKVSLDKLLTGSTNAMRISKMEKEEYIKQKLGIKDSGERKKRPKRTGAAIGTDTSSKSRNTKRRKTEVSANNESNANDGAAKNKHHSDDKESRTSPPKDSTRKNGDVLGTKNEKELVGLLEEDEEVVGDRRSSQIKTEGNGSDDILLQPSLNPDELIFMMSDSDSSFKTAFGQSDDETIPSEDNNIPEDL